MASGHAVMTLVVVVVVVVVVVAAEEELDEVVFELSPLPPIAAPLHTSLEHFQGVSATAAPSTS